MKSPPPADAGAQALTHLGNGVPGMVPRHRNPIWAGLAEERLAAMIITDGHHLPPELIRVICKVKGAAKIIVTSDASPGAGLPPGPCRVFGSDAILEPGRTALQSGYRLSRRVGGHAGGVHAPPRIPRHFQ